MKSQYHRNYLMLLWPRFVFINMDIKSILTKYIQETNSFVKVVQDMIAEVDMKATQIERDREQIIRDRTDLIAKSNSLLRQVDTMREDRDQANNKVKEAHNLKQSAIKELEEALQGVKYHHEQYDGSGYPEGLKGEQIPLIAAIISVADAFDAMTTDRPYRKGLSKVEASEEIKHVSGKQLNPKVAEAFLELYREGRI